MLRQHSGLARSSAGSMRWVTRLAGEARSDDVVGITMLVFLPPRADISSSNIRDRRWSASMSLLGLSKKKISVIRPVRNVLRAGRRSRPGRACRLSMPCRLRFSSRSSAVCTAVEIGVRRGRLIEGTRRQVVGQNAAGRGSDAFNRRSVQSSMVAITCPPIDTNARHAVPRRERAERQPPRRQHRHGPLQGAG